MHTSKLAALTALTAFIFSAQPVIACEDHASVGTGKAGKHACSGDASCPHKAGASHAHAESANQSTSSSVTTAAAKTDEQKYSLTVDGMHCQSCVDNLKSQLETMSDVVKDSLKVDLKGKQATVTLKKGSKTTASIDELKKALNAKITESGFEVTKVKIVN